MAPRTVVFAILSSNQEQKKERKVFNGRQKQLPYNSYGGNNLDLTKLDLRLLRNSASWAQSGSIISPSRPNSFGINTSTMFLGLKALTRPSLPCLPSTSALRSFLFDAPIPGSFFVFLGGVPSVDKQVTYNC